MSARICLVTTGQPSTNPRLVKEADALAANGYDVRVVGAHWAEWARDTDRQLLATKRWPAEIIDWRRHSAPLLFWRTRVRHRAARTAAQLGLRGRLVLDSAASRVTPELTRAALAQPAALFIAHNLGALPAAARAAGHYGAKLGFDAEDFHSGELAAFDPARPVVEAVEMRYLPMCDYVTAASRGIGAAYARLTRRPPAIVLNVFPLADRPAIPNVRRGGPIRLYWISQTIGPNRGLEQTVQALALLPDVPVELHLRGTWKAGYQQILTSLAERGGVPVNRIVSHAPSAPGEMTREAAAFDVGLALEPGGVDNSGIALENKFFTYLLAGLPVVASSTKAHAELAAPCGSAMELVPPGDAAALAAVIRRWHSEPELLDEARRAAWAVGTDSYNWDRESVTFLSVVRETLGATPFGCEQERGMAS